MGNIALNKTATASSFVMPYTASRAVDGSIAPIRRWLCNTVPCWMQVDLNTPQWINRYVVRNMPTSGWRNPDYNICNFKFQGSNDGYNWSDLDTVTNNNLAVVDRNITPVEVRYVRLYVTKGLLTNPQIASIMELEVYEAPPTSPYLSNITLSSGTLTPSFSKTTPGYTSSVAYDVDRITVTPTAEDPNATIKVNGVVVPSGQASEPVDLNLGSNTITIEVTSQVGGLKQTYTINVTRASSAYLEDIKYAGGRGASMSPTFSKDIFEYAATTGANSVKITPTAEDNNAKITVNNQEIQSGYECTIAVDSKPKTVTIKVFSAVGSEIKTYTIVIS